MNKLAIASLLALCSIAIADPPRPPDAPHPPSPLDHMPAQQCDKSGGVLFQERLEAESYASHQATWTITLYAHGAWERQDRDDTGRSTAHSEGCLPGDQLAMIGRMLAKATWTTKHADVACAAIGSTFMTYSSGKHAWAAHMCQIDYLDEATEKAIQTIDQLLASATAPHTPPCCKN